MSKKPDVTVYPSHEGMFFDGIPAVVQEVSEADAVWMCAAGVFTRTLPTGYRADDDGTLEPRPAEHPRPDPDPSQRPTSPAGPETPAP